MSLLKSVLVLSVILISGLAQNASAHVCVAVYKGLDGKIIELARKETGGNVADCHAFVKAEGEKKFATESCPANLQQSKTFTVQSADYWVALGHSRGVNVVFKADLNCTVRLPLPIKSQNKATAPFFAGAQDWSF